MGVVIEIEAESWGMGLDAWLLLVLMACAIVTEWCMSRTEHKQ